jgi:hypothetical protein
MQTIPDASSKMFFKSARNEAILIKLQRLELSWFDSKLD